MVYTEEDAFSLSDAHPHFDSKRLVVKAPPPNRPCLKAEAGERPNAFSLEETMNQSKLTVSPMAILPLTNRAVWRSLQDLGLVFHISQPAWTARPNRFRAQ